MTNPVHPDQPYTPSTEQVRRVYSLAPVNLLTGGKPNPDPGYAGEQFDRWLASVRRDAQADAWDECVRRVADMPISGTGYARIIRWAMPTNPYRAAAIRRGEGEEN